MAEDYTCVVDPIGNQDEDDQDDSSFISSSSDEGTVNTPKFIDHQPVNHHHEQEALSILSVLPQSSPKPPQQQLPLLHHDPLKPTTTSSNTNRVSSSSSVASMMRGGTQFLLQQGVSASMESTFLPPFSLPPSASTSTLVPPNISTTPAIPSPIISTTNTTVVSKMLNNNSKSTSVPTNDPNTTTAHSLSTTVKTSPKRKRVGSNSSNQSNQKGNSSSARPSNTQQQHAYENEIESLPTVPSGAASAYSYPNMLHSSAMTNSMGHGMMQPFYLAANGMAHDPNYLYGQTEMHWYSHYPNQYWNYYPYSQPGIPTNGIEEDQPESLVHDYTNNQASTEADTTQQNVEGTIYVNPKQYQRILKRRIARAKLEQQMKNAGQYKDKSYKYNSRHEWAKKRARGPGGRFLSKKEKQELEEKEKEGSIVEPPTQQQPQQTKPKKQSKKKPKTEASNAQSSTSLPPPFSNQPYYPSIPPNGSLNFPSEFLSLPTHQQNYKSM